MFLVWLILFCKKLLKNIVFLILLIGLPISSFLLSKTGQSGDTKIKIGIVCDENSQYSNQMIHYLTDKKESIEFIQIEHEQNLISYVSSGDIAMGYIIPNDIEKRLEQGDTKRLIKCYESPSVFFAKLIDEIVFSAIMRQQGSGMLMKYVNTSGLFTKYEVEKAAIFLPKVYRDYLNSGATFSFEYGSVEGKKVSNVDDNVLVGPVRGIVAVLILISGLFGSVMFFDYKKNGLFSRLSPNNKILGGIISILAPMVLMIISGIPTIIISEADFNMFNETAYILAYSVGILGFCYFLKSILNSGSVISGIMPLIAVGSVVFCPVFFDVNILMPNISIVGYLFLPYYYLKSVSVGFSYSVIIVLIGIVLLFFGVLIEKYTNKI